MTLQNIGVTIDEITVYPELLIGKFGKQWGTANNSIRYYR